VEAGDWILTYLGVPRSAPALSGTLEERVNAAVGDGAALTEAIAGESAARADADEALATAVGGKASTASLEAVAAARDAADDVIAAAAVAAQATADGAQTLAESVESRHLLFIQDELPEGVELPFLAIGPNTGIWIDDGSDTE
jgi:hypothetical protein